jgi:hypothetical protein
MIDELKRIVRASGRSQWELSRATGGRVVPPELSRWLSGRGCLGQAKLDALAGALGVKLVVRDRAQLRAELRDAVAAVSPARNAALAAELLADA